MATLKMQDSAWGGNDRLRTLLADCSNLEDLDANLRAEAFNCIGLYSYQMWKSRAELGENDGSYEETEKSMIVNLLNYLKMGGRSSGYAYMKALHLLVRVLMEKISIPSNKGSDEPSASNPEISSIEGIIAAWNGFPLAIPPETWAFVFPQLIAMSRTTTACARDLVKKILSHVAINIPNRVAFTLLVEANSRTEFRFHENGNEILKSIADELPSQLRESLSTLITGLKKIAVLWEEKWYSLLYDIEMEIKKRYESINARREAIDASYVVSEDLKRAALEREVQSTMSPIVRLLKSHMKVCINGTSAKGRKILIYLSIP